MTFYQWPFINDLLSNDYNGVMANKSLTDCERVLAGWRYEVVTRIWFFWWFLWWSWWWSWWWSGWWSLWLLETIESEDELKPESGILSLALFSLSLPQMLSQSTVPMMRSLVLSSTIPRYSRSSSVILRTDSVVSKPLSTNFGISVSRFIDDNKSETLLDLWQRFWSSG